MATILQTTADDLVRISKERGREYDPDKHVAWCGECGAPVSGSQFGASSFAFGIMHWPDCSGDETMIRFREAG